MAKSKQKINTEGSDSLFGNNPFAGLSGAGLPPAPQKAEEASSTRSSRRVRKGPRPRLDIRRLKSGKGGKTVTEISGFIGKSSEELVQLGKQLKAFCGVGGTVKGGVIELQGEQWDKIEPLLTEMGYRLVRSGG